MKAKTKISKIISTIAMMLCLIISLSSVTYSWIKREWTPNVAGSNIQIAADGSLVFSLVDGEGVGSIQDKLSLSDKYPLRPVSSQNGVHGTFFNVNYLQDEYKFKLIEEGSKTGDELLNEFGFTELVFLVQAAEGEGDGVIAKEKYIFLTPQCYITATDESQKVNSIEAAQSIRVAIDIQHPDSTNITTLMFKNQDQEFVNGSYQLQYDEVTSLPLVTHTGVTAEKGSDGKFIADGKPYDAVDEETGEKLYEETRTANLFSDYYGGIWEKLDPSEYDNSGETLKVLYNGVMSETTTDKESQLFRGYYYFDGTDMYMRNIEKKPVGAKCIGILGKGEDYLQLKVRVWLEGCDKYCTSNIRNYYVSLLVMFDFMDVE